MVALLPPSHEAFIKKSVDSGEFRSREELLQRAVELLMKQREFHAMIQAGLDQADRGELVAADEVHKRMDEVIDRLTRQAKQRK